MRTRTVLLPLLALFVLLQAGCGPTAPRQASAQDDELEPVVVLMNLMMTSSGTFPKWVDEAHLTALNGLVEGILSLF